MLQILEDSLFLSNQLVLKDNKISTVIKMTSQLASNYSNRVEFIGMRFSLRV